VASKFQLLHHHPETYYIGCKGMACNIALRDTVSIEIKLKYRKQKGKKGDQKKKQINLNVLVLSYRKKRSKISSSVETKNGSYKNAAKGL